MGSGPYLNNDNRVELRERDGEVVVTIPRDVLKHAAADVGDIVIPGTDDLGGIILSPETEEHARLYEEYVDDLD